MDTPQTFERGLTFEKVWAAIQETGRQIKETDRQMKETREQMKENDKKMGFLSNRFGELVEHMIVPNMIEKFNAMGFNFIQADGDRVIKDRKNGIFMEIDIVLENGEYAMAVEIKSKAKTEDVHEHIERMEKIRAFADLHNDKRTWYGAIAGAIMNDDVRTYALKKGFYVIEPSGDTVHITPPPTEPKAW
jgi:Holliday junction resolvase-like predicted endonuclease